MRSTCLINTARREFTMLTYSFALRRCGIIQDYSGECPEEKEILNAREYYNSVFGSPPAFRNCRCHFAIIGAISQLQVSHFPIS